MKIQYTRLLLLFIFVINLIFLSGENTYSSAIKNHNLVLEFPILDAPFNTHPHANFPSMKQSLHISKNFYQIPHAYILDLLDKNPRWQQFFSIAAFDILSTWLPFGMSWLHEESHRAVLGIRGIESHNDVYDFNLFEDLIAVSKIKDKDLVWLKKDHPQEMTRLHAAGIEAQYEMNLLIEKDQFFYDSYAFEDMILWINYLNSIMYIDTCTTSDADEMTDEMMEEEGDDISERDFTGLDFTAWVYDLFRPYEPYEARGIHPSGKGIKRYIKYSDLTADEKDYLKLQRNLSLLNLVNPILFRKVQFKGTNPFSGDFFKWNMTLRHHLTPFGYNIAANIFHKKKSVNTLVKLNIYRNKYRTYPGMEFELLRYPGKLLKKDVNISFLSGIFLQPEDQMFRTKSSEPGGILSLKISSPITDHLELYLNLEGKTNGWVPGNVYLEENFSTVLGVIVL